MNPGDSAPPRAARPSRPVKPPRSDLARSTAKWMFHSHLWLGILTTGIVLVISITGILLNHKRPLGLMPDVAHQPTAAFDAALPLAELGRLASAALPAEAAGAPIDRMDVRPDDGLIKVRFDDRRVMEVTLDLSTGAVLAVDERNDVFLEKLHSGEIFGDLWVLLSDAGAVLLVIVLISGLWLWLYPKARTG